MRGKTGQVFGDLTALLTLMKSLPLAYNRDMQEDKEPMFRTVDTLHACIGIYSRMLPKLKVRHAAMARATASGFLNATDMADYLVSKGVPFRDAHSHVGKAVTYALDQNKELHELSLEELTRFSSQIEANIYDFLTVAQMIDRRLSAGGTATVNVTSAIAAARQNLKEMDASWKLRIAGT